jgi:hypothetical protein
VQAVPAIQSDFARLRTVAVVGEELARIVELPKAEQEALLILFQSLQTNARWWNILSTYGMKIDPRAFTSRDQNQVRQDYYV